MRHLKGNGAGTVGVAYDPAELTTESTKKSGGRRPNVERNRRKSMRSKLTDAESVAKIQERNATNRIKKPSRDVTQDGQSAAQTIILPAMDFRTVTLDIVGDTPLICNRKTERQAKLITDKQTGKPNAGKQQRNLELEYKESMYKIKGGGYGFPACAFVEAAVSACTSLGKKVISKTQARQAFRVVGHELVKLAGKPEKHIELVRRPPRTGGLGPCWRAKFSKWSTKITIKFNACVLSVEEVANLFNLAGFAVGVGDGRPEKTGGRSFGMFHVE